MMQPLQCLLSISLMAAATASAHAQVTLDVSKVTCDQWAGYKITNPQNIALIREGSTAVSRPGSKMPQIPHIVSKLR